MNPDSPVVLNKSELPETAQESIHSRPRAANHARQGLLGDGLNQHIVFSRLAVFRQQQKHSSQSLFRPVEELIHQVRLRSQIAFQQK